MSNENLSLWNRHKKTDPRFATKVEYGGFKYTSMNPQELIHKATEEWGPCGTGWGYDYAIEFKDFTNGAVCCFCNMELWYLGDDGEKKFAKHTGVSDYATVNSNSGVTRIDK